jgi:HK97 family phage prohead protease
MSVNVVELDLEAAQFKAAEMVATGLRTLEFYAAAFSKTPDSNGDVIDPHAFDDWLQAFYAVGKPLPISFSHAAVLDSLDPTNVIGYAPADPEHVWVDDYGLRVRGFIDTSSEKGKAVEWQIENGLLGGASIAYIVPPKGKTKSGVGSRITKISSVRETGPTPNPANQEAVLLWMKSEGMLEQETECPYMTVEEFRETFLKAVDNSVWDGNRAMGQCSTAAEYRSICAGEHSAGTPDERQHWALPHHYLGRPPNAAGVRNALARLPQTQGLTNKQVAQNHLEGHMSSVNPETASADESTTDVKHAASPAYIQAAHDALVRGGAKCAADGEETSTASELDIDAERLRHLRFMKSSLV